MEIWLLLVELSQRGDRWSQIASSNVQSGQLQNGFREIRLNGERLSKTSHGSSIVFVEEVRICQLILSLSRLRVRGGYSLKFGHRICGIALGSQEPARQHHG